MSGGVGEVAGAIPLPRPDQLMYNDERSSVGMHPATLQRCERGNGSSHCDDTGRAASMAVFPFMPSGALEHGNDLKFFFRVFRGHYFSLASLMNRRRLFAIHFLQERRNREGRQKYQPNHLKQMVKRHHFGFTQGQPGHLL